MKSSLIFFIVVLSVIVVLNEACGGQRSVRTTPTTRPATSSTSQPVSRPKKIHRHRIFSFSLVTTKPRVKPVCTKPNLCLNKCGTSRYIVGRYNCTGQSWCCKLY